MAQLRKPVATAGGDMAPPTPLLFLRKPIRMGRVDSKSLLFPGIPIQNDPREF
jgi:hypothetical protein